MKIGTMLLTYTRVEHTKKVLEELKNNSVLPEKLYVFQDGKKQSTNHADWETVNRLINSISWCDTEVLSWEKNQGIAVSIVQGINRVLQENDAVIVIEDDCVPHRLFMKYMTEALKKYENEKKIYSVGGYAWPVEVTDNGTDAYFTKRISSWGWGTWKDRWQFYDEDYRILGRVKKDEYLLKQFHIWGEDLENYLYGNVDGRCDAWDVFWAFNVLEKDGYCVAPYRSLINNIGFDGTGVHCGTQEIKTVLETIAEKEFCFPEEIEITKETEDNFSDYFSWLPRSVKDRCYYKIFAKWVQMHIQKKTIQEYLDKNSIHKVCIWGRGPVCKLVIHEIQEAAQILGIVESSPQLKDYQGIDIVNPEQVHEETELIILIPEYDEERIRRTLPDNMKEKVKLISEILDEII